MIERRFTELLATVIDNRGKTCPTADSGYKLIATNCIKNDGLWPIYDKVRYVDDQTYATWFRGHPEPDDIIFVTKGTPGRCALVPTKIDFCIAQDMVSLRADRKVTYPRYLFAALRSPLVQNRINNMHVGSLIPHFKKGHFDQLMIPLPEMADQIRTGDMYYHLNYKIELNRKMNETLEAMARALFKSWFVDFDPVRKKMRGEPTGLPAEIDALFPGEMEDSALGDGSTALTAGIPKGWRVGKLGETFNITMGQSPPGETYNEAQIGLPFYQGRTDFGFRYPKVRMYCSEPKRLAQAGDTLVSVRAPVGDLNIAMSECCIGRGVAAVRHKSLSEGYTYYALGSIQPKLEAFESEGTVFGAINKESFENLTIIEPAADLIAEYEKVVQVMDDKIRLQSLQIEELTAIRDTLLPKLISGELRVRDAERFVGGG